MFPPTNQITPRQFGILFHLGEVWWGISRNSYDLSGIAVIKVTLKRQRVAIVQFPICSESSLCHSPIIKLPTVRMELRATSESFPINTIIKGLPISGSIPKIQEALIEISTSRRCEYPMSVSGILGDDVNHGVDSICSPDRATWPAAHLDALDILQKCVLNLPPDSSEERRVDTSSVDKHQHRPREGASKSADPNRPCVRVDSRDFNPRCQAKDFWDARCTGAPNIFLGNNVDCRRS